MRDATGPQATHAAPGRPFGSLVVRPLRAFFRMEAASGIVLLACAIAALAWANLIDPASYRALLRAQLGVSIGAVGAHFTVHQLVDDGLMAAFFFLVGMEIKRELVLGALRTRAQAMLPAIGALGGMIVPAGIYLALNHGGPGRAGWGIPMATDIAFCVGILTLLRRRVPHALVVFLTALAIFDDIGGILVIAVFYGAELHAGALAAAAGLLLLLAVMARRQVASAAPFVAAGVALWYALHAGGVHPTLAGVAVGLAVPARARRRPREVLESLSIRASELLRRRRADEELDAAAVLALGERLDGLEAPLDRLVQRLHPWVAFGVMPLFALANSGVDLRGLSASQLTGPVTVGTAIALLLGKPIGIFGLTAAAVRLGAAPFPGDASAAKVLGASIVGGIGFTVALFIAGLAFPGDPALLEEAKVGILVGSLASGIAGALVLRLTPPVGAALSHRPRPPHGAAAPGGPVAATSSAGSE